MWTNNGLRRPAGDAATLPPAVVFFSSRRRHTRCGRGWSSDVCSSDLLARPQALAPPWSERPLGVAGDARWAALGNSLSESSERGRGRSLFQAPPDELRALLRTLDRRVDLEVIDAGNVDLPLPRPHRRRERVGARTGGVLAFASRLTGVTSFHDDLDRTANSDEEHPHPESRLAQSARIFSS